jgi:hypothetical protein
MTEKKNIKKDKENVNEEEKIIKQERKEENKILKIVLVFIGIFFLGIIVAFFIMRTSNHPKFGGLTFNVIQEGEITFYQTSIPVIYKGEVAEYNIYLRNNPEKLEKKVPFEGTISSVDNTVINITREFNCEGDQMIAIANLVNLYGAIGKDLMRDENASCDELGRYMYIVVQPGEKTSVEKFGPNCYNINIKDCEILEGTERFIVEMLAKIHADIYRD